MARWAPALPSDAEAGVALRAARAAVAALVLLGCAACGAQAPADDVEAADEDLEISSLAVAEDVSPAAAASPEPLVTTEPDEYSQVGDLVDGFPIDLLPVPRDAVILVTSAVPVGEAAVQEVSLNLRTASTASELLDLYRTTLTEAGFSEVGGEEAESDLAAQVTFVRSGGDEVVSIGVLDVDGARTVTIGGRVRTAHAD